MAENIFIANKSLVSSVVKLVCLTKEIFGINQKKSAW